MPANPLIEFDCLVELPAWRVLATHLARRDERELGNVMETALRGAIAHARSCAPGGRLGASQTVAAIRSSLVDLGLDPTRTPPASEHLIRRVLEDPTSANHSLNWQFLVILTLKSQAPWTVIPGERLSTSMTFRLGVEGESLPGLEGQLSCQSLPVLADPHGLLASPWSLPDPEQIADCAAPLFVCFLPSEVYRKIEPMAHMGRAVWLTWAYRFLRQRSFSFRPAGR